MKKADKKRTDRNKRVLQGIFAEALSHKQNAEDNESPISKEESMRNFATAMAMAKKIASKLDQDVDEAWAKYIRGDRDKPELNIGENSISILRWWKRHESTWVMGVISLCSSLAGVHVFTRSRIKENKYEPGLDLVISGEEENIDLFILLADEIVDKARAWHKIDASAEKLFRAKVRTKFNPNAYKRSFFRGFITGVQEAKAEADKKAREESSS